MSRYTCSNNTFGSDDRRVHLENRSVCLYVQTFTIVNQLSFYYFLDAVPSSIDQ